MKGGGLSLRGKMSLVIQEGLRVELLLLPKYLGHGEKPRGKPRTHWGDYIFPLAYLGYPDGWMD